MRPLLGSCLLVCCLTAPTLSYAQTNDWTVVRALPRETRVIVRELDRHGRDVGYVRGRLLIANDSELTVLRSGRPLVIPRDMIGHLYQMRRDPVWEGFALGVVYWLVMRVTYAGESCLTRPEPQCTLEGIAIFGGLGAMVDLTNEEERLVYRAPKGAVPRAKPRVTLLRLSF